MGSFEDVDCLRNPSCDLDVANSIRILIMFPVIVGRTEVTPGDTWRHQLTLPYWLSHTAEVTAARNAGIVVKSDVTHEYAHIPTTRFAFNDGNHSGRADRTIYRAL